MWILCTEDSGRSVVPRFASKSYEETGILFRARGTSHQFQRGVMSQFQSILIARDQPWHPRSISTVISPRTLSDSPSYYNFHQFNALTLTVVISYSTAIIRASQDLTRKPINAQLRSRLLLDPRDPARLTRGTQIASRRLFSALLELEYSACETRLRDSATPVLLC